MNLKHPCAETCSGYKQAAEEATMELRDEIIRLRKALHAECFCTIDDYTGKKVLCDPCIALNNSPFKTATNL